MIQMFHEILQVTKQKKYLVFLIDFLSLGHSVSGVTINSTSSYTHVKISQAVNKLCSRGLLQVVNKFGTSC